jgi:hypothetical protein
MRWAPVTGKTGAPFREAKGGEKVAIHKTEPMLPVVSVTKLS